MSKIYRKQYYPLFSLQSAIQNIHNFPVGCREELVAYLKAGIKHETNTYPIVMAAVKVRYPDISDREQLEDKLFTFWHQLKNNYFSSPKDKFLLREFLRALNSEILKSWED